MRMALGQITERMLFERHWLVPRAETPVTTFQGGGNSPGLLTRLKAGHS